MLVGRTLNGRGGNRARSAVARLPAPLTARTNRFGTTISRAFKVATKAASASMSTT